MHDDDDDGAVVKVWEPSFGGLNRWEGLAGVTGLSDKGPPPSHSETIPFVFLLPRILINGGGGGVILFIHFFVRSSLSLWWLLIESFACSPDEGGSPSSHPQSRLNTSIPFPNVYLNQTETWPNKHFLFYFPLFPLEWRSLENSYDLICAPERNR